MSRYVAGIRRILVNLLACNAIATIVDCLSSSIPKLSITSLATYTRSLRLLMGHACHAGTD